MVADVRAGSICALIYLVSMATPMESIADRIRSLKEKHNAVILAHNYCLAEVQDVADHVGDSLGLSIKASETDADVIVFCGVTFMAESAKILNPGKKVLMPEPEALCAMAAMCSPDQIDRAREEHPGAEVVGYVNSTAACKARMDVCCTSSNAVDIVGNLGSKDVIFVPDKNLGAYAASKCTDKDVHLWTGFCPIHQSITADQVRRLKDAYPGAPVIAHPECRPDVLALADHIGSTEKMIGISNNSDSEDIIIVTEVGMKHRLEKMCPGKRFHFPEHAVCSAMKMTTLDSVLHALETLDGEVLLEKDVLDRAYLPVKRMIGKD